MSHDDFLGELHYGAGVGELDERASARGHELAPQLDENGGEFILVGTFDEDEDGGVMWLAKAVPVQRFDGGCCLQVKKGMMTHENESRGTHNNKGDYAIAVEWFERPADDPERRAFVKGGGAVCFINSTELRRITGEVGKCDCSGACACGGIVDTVGASWKLSRLAEFQGLEWCRC